jgi:hypothetical protein
MQVKLMRLQVLTATSVKIAVFWDVKLCSVVDRPIDLCLREVFCLHRQGE